MAKKLREEMFGFHSPRQIGVGGERVEEVGGGGGEGPVSSLTRLSKFKRTCTSMRPTRPAGRQFGPQQHFPLSPCLFLPTTVVVVNRVGWVQDYAKPMLLASLLGIHCSSLCPCRLVLSFSYLSLPTVTM